MSLRRFYKTTDLKIYLYFLWPWTFEFVVFLQNCLPKCFWHFLCPQTCEFLAFFVTAYMQVFGIIFWLQTCEFSYFLWQRMWEFLVDFCDCRPATSSYFYETVDIRILAFFVTTDLWVLAFFLTRTCKILAVISDCTTASYWQFLRRWTCDTLVVFCDRASATFWHFGDSSPANSWYFCVTADLRVFFNFCVLKLANF